MSVVKIIAFLDLEPRLNIKLDLTGQAKLNIFKRLLNLILMLLVTKTIKSKTAEIFAFEIQSQYQIFPESSK
jgi:hypothetical protein